MWVGSMAHALKSPSYEGYTAGRTLIQTIWDVMLYSQHFTFHWKLLGLVSSIEKSGTGDNNFGKCMERDISVRPTEMTRTVTVDHLQSWSLFRSDQTEMVRSIWVEVPTEITGILGWMESARRLTNDRRNSILMTRHYLDLSGAPDWWKTCIIQSEVLPRSG